MGEAKRRKQLDANYGNPLHSRGRKARISHVVAPAPPESTAADPYEQHVREVVRTYQAALVENAQATRNSLGCMHEEADLCLIAMRTYDGTEQMRMKFARIEEGKRHLLEMLESARYSDSRIDSQLDQLLSKRRSDQFLWIHADVLRTVLVARIVPIENAEIARICHVQNAMKEATNGTSL